MNLEDCIRTVFQERLSMSTAAQENLVDLHTSALRHVDAREECARLTKTLETKNEEMQIQRGSLRQREENINKKEDKLVKSMLQYNKFLQENDGRRLRAIKKAEAERAQITLKELEIQKMKTETEGLVAQKLLLEDHVRKAKCYEDFLEKSAEMSGKFENAVQVINRLHALRAIHKELLEKQTVVEKQRESTKLELMQYINKQRTVLLHHNNQLHQQQTQLDNIRLEAYKWELKLKHFYSTAAKETLLFAQLKATIYNISQMIKNHKRKFSVDTEDTFKQLEMIQKYFQLMESINDDLKFNIL